MDVLLLTRPDGTSLVSCERRGRALRLAVRLRRWHLDRALASGASPDAQAELSLRARELIGRSSRAAIAREIERVLRDARWPPAPARMCVLPCRRQVLAAEPVLRELARMLIAPAPVDVRGVAQARMLVRDGAGPVYSPAAEGRLQELAQAAIDALAPRLPDDDD
ncbi:MAG TPA: hypothetical protein VKV27_11000 [Solirubrobacteraceae bacterium]|nr:hypothetical protein [Solirubrobacteraceae bacterium]